MAVILTVGALPQTRTTGNWPFTTMNTGRWHFVWTPTNANTDVSWDSSFHALVAANDNGGIWIVNDALELYDQSGSLIVSVALTWGAGAAIDLTFDMGVGEIVISGATTGNGTHSFSTAGDVFSNVTLGLGVYGGGGNNLEASTFSDIDDDASTYTLAADVRTYALAGITTGLTAQRTLGGDVRTYALTGINATLTASSPSTPSVGTTFDEEIGAGLFDEDTWFQLDEPAAAGAATLAADIRTYALAGTDTGLLRGLRMDADVRTFALAGIDAGLHRGVTMAADIQTFTVTRVDAGLTARRRLTADLRTYALTGINAGLLRGLRLAADTQTCALAGTVTSLTAGRLVTADVRSYALTGIDAGLTTARTLAADVRAYTLTGIDASLEADRLLTADVQSHSLTGIDAALTFTPFGAYTLTADARTFALTGNDAQLRALQWGSGGSFFCCSE